MEQHLKLAAMLNIALGGLGLLFGILVLIVLGGAAGITELLLSGEPEARFVGPVLGIVGLMVFLCILVLSAPGVIAGFGMLAGKPWARILGILVGGLSLLSIPFGTVVGAYTLWVLLSSETDPLFSSRARSGAGG